MSATESALLSLTEVAQAIAQNLGAELIELPIEDLMRAYEAALAERFADRDPDTAEENLQARVRGNLVMALSNKFGWLVLTTGNKSELSVGYATLYGDMAGGFAVLKDVFKGTVYRLVEWRNQQAGHEHHVGIDRQERLRRGAGHRPRDE